MKSAMASETGGREASAANTPRFALRDPTIPLDSLTPREYEVLTLSDGTLSLKEIGAKLGITERTAKHHSDQCRAKLLPPGARRRHLYKIARELSTLYGRNDEP